LVWQKSMATACNLTDPVSSQPILISGKEVCRRTSLSRASLYRLMAQDAFPKSVALHGVRKAWIESEVGDWVAARIAARNESLGAREARP
jgi:prophage regulatory protein